MRALWVLVALVGLAACAAPGARVAVTAGGRTQVGVVQAGSSYLSTRPPSLTVGLGAAATAERVEVGFADGTTRVLTDIAAGVVVVARD